MSKQIDGKMARGASRVMLAYKNPRPRSVRQSHEDTRS